MRVRVCIHALTWVTAQLCCLTWSSPSSDCIVQLDLNFILVKKKERDKKNRKARLQAAQAGVHSFGRMSARTDPEMSPQTLFGT